MNYERIDDNKQFDGAVRDSHEARYHIASGFIGDSDDILDAGCGVGYGMPILLTPARVEAGATYLGIDKNPVGDPELFQKVNFEDPNDGAEWPDSFDVFVGFEIIEHLDPVGHFINLAKKAKKWIIVSTPIVPNSNPHHKQQFTEAMMLAMFTGDGWTHYQTFTQGEGRTYGIFIFKRA
jgi:2-polyprenyl-3-methyl-5-hydroxy-6-metoxy-1,4-benzoquinol methylase